MCRCAICSATLPTAARANGYSAAGYAAVGSGPSYSGVAGPTGNEGKESRYFGRARRTVSASSRCWPAVDVDGDGNARGYDITTGGFTLGIDEASPNFVLGLNAGYAGTGADY